MGTAQLKNRMEGSGRRQLTGEPTFLTQVPKESDANTPSALSIAFIHCLLRVQSPFGEGSSLGTVGSACSLLGCVLGLGSGQHSWRIQSFTSICKYPLGAGGSHLLSATSLCSLLFLSLPHSLQLGFELGLEMRILALWHCICHLGNKSKRNSLGNGKKMTSCCDFLSFLFFFCFFFLIFET